MARRVMEQLVATGKVSHGRIGVVVEELGAREEVKNTPNQGAVIAAVVAGSAAARAGIQKGDIVVAADGKPIRSASQLRNIIGLTPVGSRIQLTIERKQSTEKISIEVTPAKDSNTTLSNGSP
jgi:serine protease Do